MVSTIARLLPLYRKAHDMKKGRTHRKLWWALILTPILLVLLLGVLIYLPVFQRWAVNRVVATIEQSTGWDVSIGKARLRFPLKVEVDDLLAMDRQDTVMWVDQLQTSIPVMPLFNSRIEVPHLEVSRGRVDLPLDSLDYSRIGAAFETIEAGHVQIDLKSMDIDVAAVLIRGGFFAYTQRDTLPSSGPGPEMSIAVNRIDLEDFASHIHLFPSGVHTDAHMIRGGVDKGILLLPNFSLRLEHIEAQLSEATYAIDTAQVKYPWVDYTHMRYYDADLNLDDFYVDAKGKLDIDINHARLREQSGAVVQAMNGRFSLENSVVSVRDFDLTTAYSSLVGDVVLPLKAFMGDHSASGVARVNGKLDPRDLYYYTRISLDSLLYQGSRHPELARRAMDVDAALHGSIDRMEISKLRLSIPQLLSIDLQGSGYKLLDESLRRVSLQGDMRTQTHASILLDKIGAADGSMALPPSTRLQLRGSLQGDVAQAQIKLATPQGEANLTGSYGIKSQRYRLRGSIGGLNVQQFLPKQLIGSLSATINTSGQGFDFTSPRTSTDLDLQLSRLYYNGQQIDSVKVQGALRHGALDATIRSDQEFAKLQAILQGKMTKRDIAAHLDLNVDHIDLYRLGLTDSIMSGGLTLSAQIYSDYKQTHRLDGLLSDICLKTATDTIRAQQLQVQLQSDDRRVLTKVSSDDLTVDLSTDEGLSSFLNSIAKVSTWASNYQFDNPKLTAYSDLIASLPATQLSLHAGKDNPLSTLLKEQAIAFKDLQVELRTDPRSGIEGSILADHLQYDTIQSDRVSVKISTLFPSQPVILDQLSGIAEQLPSDEMRPLLMSDLHQQFDQPRLSTRFYYPLLLIDVQASADRKADKLPYMIAAQIQTDLVGVDLSLDWIQDHQIYYSLGAVGYYNAKGFGLSFKDKAIYLAGEMLQANEGNALFYFRENNQVYANLKLSSPTGAELSIHSDSEEQSNIESLNVNVKQLQLADLVRVLRLPDVSGRTFLDLRIEREGEVYRATGDLSVNEMTYNDVHLGHVSVAFFYEPRDNASHYITAQVSSNGDLAFTADGVYRTQDKASPLDMTATFDGFPLQLANPFLGTDLFSLSGSLHGAVQIGGTPNDLRLNGSPHIQSGLIAVKLTGNNYQLDAQPIVIKDSKLSFDKYALTLKGKKTPLLVDGEITLFGSDAMQSNLRLTADRAQILDSKSSRKQAIYGRAILSADISVRDKLTAPRVDGSLTLHGGTNAVYVLSQSDVRAKDNMQGVVEFMSFADTLTTDKLPEFSRHTLGRMNLSVALNIEPAVQLGVDFSTSGQDYARIIGGGNFRLSYPPLGDMNLVGRYEFTGGEVLYNFPVVGRRLFEVDPESYLVWSGDPMSPYLHFIASQKLRADVMEGEDRRKTDFKVLIKADQDIKDLDLIFDLEAPDDLNTQTKLSSMSSEERAKQAVALLLSGTFLSDMGQISMEQVLSSVAMNELNNLTGKLLQGTDISLGMELGGFNGATPMQTNYTYSFSKRFFNDRIRFVIGGRVASGNLPSNYEQTFIDNVTFEYRLDEAGRQYVTLFHRRNNDNILEGLVTETGISYLFKVKGRTLGDLLDWRNLAWWRKRETAPIPQKLPTQESPSTPNALAPLLQPTDSLSTNRKASSTHHHER